ncbi:MAG: hypothetical protein JW844_08655 [Candidatus Omnitrophica bacterium]|nr:hypothetical protein [Candidatus Omnitrophota bacterium]
MSSKGHLVEFMQSILEAEIKAKNLYQHCLDSVSDPTCVSVIRPIRDDEEHHEALVREIIDLLSG